MPKDNDRLQPKEDLTPEEFAAQKEQQEEETVPTHGLLGKLFRREETELQSKDEESPKEVSTGEISLNDSGDGPKSDPQPTVSTEDRKNLNEPEKPASQEDADADFSVPLAPDEPKPAAEKKKSTEQDSVKQLPQEEKAHRELQELRAMLYNIGKTAQEPAEPDLKSETAESAPVSSAEKTEEPQQPWPRAVFAAEKAADKQGSAFRFFGEGGDEVKAPTRTTEPSMDDSMSLPLIAWEDVDEGPSEQSKKTKTSAKQETNESKTEDSETTEEEEDDTPKTPEQVGERLRQMGVTLTLRCVLSGVLALILLHFGLVSEGLAAPVASLDPVVAPAAFYAANMLALAAAMAVGYPVLRDGLNGLKKDGRASSDTMPALAACGAMLEAVITLLNARSYQPSGFTLLSGIAALGLFMALLGSRVMLAAVKNGYDLAMREPEHRGAFRVKNKDLIRTLSKSLEQKDPWILLSRKTDWSETFIDLSFSERTSERRAKKNSYILLGAAVLSGLVFLLFGGGVNGMAAASTAMLCMGAPLSSTFIAGLTALRLQNSAEAVGAVVPGWTSIEELGGVDTVQVSSDDLFANDSVNLEDIRIFKGGRIDRAILYAASILNQSCDTLRGLFRQIIEDKTEILYPVKDLEVHTGLGFAAWCDNNRILIGNRAYLESEGVTVPEIGYEKEHSKNGSLQILYLAVSGNLHAMFVLRYIGVRNVARNLEILQKENIHLMVNCLDPSLTAKHITDAYHLPEGMVTLLDREQVDALHAVENAELPEKEPKDACCMIHTKGFTSLAGGLRAAEQAQNAETTATTVQVVSVWFSVAIGILLTYAGSIGFLSMAAILMYQAAWSGLSIFICAMKQHN